jgi:3-oxoacyl-[acyl-carrier protein] reductase
MSDRYQQLVNTPVGRIVSRQVGLPSPVKLDRYEPGRPVIDGPVLLGASASGGRLGDAIRSVLTEINAEVLETPPGAEEQTFKALVFDGTQIKDTRDLRDAWAFFHPSIRRVRTNGRVIVLGTPPPLAEDPQEATAQWALDGLVRSIGKEVKKGATTQMIYVAPGAEAQISSTLRFFLSPKSAYVSGQVVEIGAPVSTENGPTELDWNKPLSDKVALVTGAARGIGEAIATVLARDGAHVVGVDIPAQADDLDRLMNHLGGSALTADITAEDAPARITSHLLGEHGGADIVVHNAGVTRDKTLGRMSEDQWSTVLGINLLAPHRIDSELFGRDAVRQNGRVVMVSSISGIAGNAGQTNYATSKAGVIGMVHAYAPRLEARGVTINAVAPGFIETAMTAAMPLTIREAGRRMNSMSQGGLPVDVAETIAWFANPASAGVNGNVVRVCGQSLIGA